MYYVLALNLFFGEAYEEVLRQLVNGLKFLGNWRQSWEIPTTSAISQARTRLGEAPMKLLFERIAVPMARAGTRGAWYRGLRVSRTAGDGHRRAGAGRARHQGQRRGVRALRQRGRAQPVPAGSAGRGGRVRHPRHRRCRVRSG